MITTTLPFKTLKEVFQQNALTLVKDAYYLFVTDVTKDELWETYINSFPESIRQEYNCNSCRSFIKGYGNIVLIDKDYQLRSLWNVQVDDSLFQDIFYRLDALVTSKPIRDAFISDTVKLGTDSNVELLENGPPHRWHHLSLQLPERFKVSVSSTTLDTIRGERRSQKDVLKRSLEELSISATQTALELIASNSIYRGQEFKGLLNRFWVVQNEYASENEAVKDNFCWEWAAKASGDLCKIRNTAIGTLLVDLSNDLDLNEAVGRFERVMAPTNYKRPTPVFTKRMVEDAERKIAELGLTDSLARRHTTLNDVTVNNLLFVDRSSRRQTASIFDSLKQDATVNPKQFAKVQSINLDSFIQDVLPTVQSVELLLENKHQSNLVSLIAPVNPDAPSLFKWGNGFSWSYSGAYADSVKERVKKAGGQVEGQLRISLAWSNYDDLDLHLIEPSGEHISFRNKRSVSGGQLDVDMNAGSGQTRDPVENIYYGYNRSLPEGVYQCHVEQYCQRERVDVGFSVEVEYDSNIQVFEYAEEVRQNAKVDVLTFSYSKATGFKILSSNEESNKVKSKELWGLNTNQFHKVNALLFSPNHWHTEKGIGNKHLFAILDKCHNNEPKVRGFFNEFLREEFTPHRKVFEALANRLEVSNNVGDSQLSGIGFSLTKPNEFYAKVKGQTERVLKVVI
jgi:hypothetical protein